MAQIALNKVAPEEIRAELDRILSSPDFRASKRRRDFLRFIVEETLAGRDEIIKAYTIAINVFGRSKDFDPQIDPIVSVEAGRLRRSLEHYYMSGGQDNALRIEIPKGTYVPHFIRNEDGYAALSSTKPAIVQYTCLDESASELARPGIAIIVFDNLSKKEGQDFFATGISAQLVANLAQFKDFVVVGPLLRERLEDPNLSLSTIGTKYGVQFVLTGSVQRRGKRIRVIAKLLDVESAENIWVKQFDRDLTVSDQYEIEDEITQQITSTLADRIGVITRILVKKTQNKPLSDLTAFEAALKMYHWGIVLTETAFQDAWRSLENIWVKQFDRDLTVSDQYEIEDEITQQITATLADRIGVITRFLVKKTHNKSCSDLTAFEAALKMYHWGIVLTEAAFQDAWKSLEYAVKKVPNDALTKAMLADIYASDYLSEIGLVKNRMAKAEELAREAVALDPDCPDARWVMGFVHFLRRRPEKFINEFETALALNPQNAMILAIYGLFLPGLGEWERGVEFIEKARMLNPQLSSQYYITTCLNYYRKGNFERAYAESLHINTPGLFWESLVNAAVLGQLGRTDDAQPYLQNLLSLQPSFKDNGHDLVRRLLYSELNVDMVYKGLQKAGFPMDANRKLRPIRTA